MPRYSDIQIHMKLAHEYDENVTVKTNLELWRESKILGKMIFHDTTNGARESRRFYSINLGHFGKRLFGRKCECGVGSNK